MQVYPNSIVKLLRNVKLTPDMSNTFYFEDKDEQTQYFTGHSKYVVNNCTYIRKGETMAIAMPYCKDDLLDVNYVMYQNTSFGNKWFYAFVTQIDYVNNDVSHIYLSEDSVQTWLFDISFNEVLIDRQHSETDNYGENDLDEPITTGEDYVVDSSGGAIPFYDSLETRNTYLHWMIPVMAVSEKLDGVYIDEDIMEFQLLIDDGTLVYLDAGNRGSVYSPMIYLYPAKTYVDDPSYAENITKAILAYTKANKKDAIQSIFMMPWAFLHESDNTITWHIDNTLQVGNYTPFNKKLLQYPYKYLRVNNASGVSMDYSWEESSVSAASPRLSFECRCDLSPNPLPFMYPKNYRGLVNDYQEGIFMSAVAQCAWAEDPYTAWVANLGAEQMAVNLGVSTLAGVANTGINLMQGRGSEAITSAINTALDIYNAGVDVRNVNSQPQVIKGNKSVNFFNYAGLNDFYFSVISVKPEYARMIDDFFTMYGYAQKKVAKPNIHARSRFTYVKVSGYAIKGNIPSYAKNRINDSFNSGITFWGDKGNFMDYDMTTHPNSVL